MSFNLAEAFNYKVHIYVDIGFNYKKVEVLSPLSNKKADKILQNIMPYSDYLCTTYKQNRNIKDFDYKIFMNRDKNN